MQPCALEKSNFVIMGYELAESYINIQDIGVLGFGSQWQSWHSSKLVSVFVGQSPRRWPNKKQTQAHSGVQLN